MTNKPTKQPTKQPCPKCKGSGMAIVSKNVQRVEIGEPGKPGSYFFEQMVPVTVLCPGCFGKGLR